jgi:PPOX class probable F420-dependent enzyme
MSRRDQIGLTEDEVRVYLEQSQTIILVSQGPGGFPHPMPMWFAVDEDGAICMATYRSSQKIKNIQRDPRVSLLVESGDNYAQLKGIVIYGRAEIIDDFDRVTDVLLAAAGAENNDTTRQGVAKTAAKRYLIRVEPERIVSWDHAKLGGTY